MIRDKIGIVFFLIVVGITEIQRIFIIYLNESSDGIDIFTYARASRCANFSVTWLVAVELMGQIFTLSISSGVA